MSEADFDCFIAALREAPRQVIHAVIYPAGVGAGKSPEETLWHMTFELAAWALPEGPVHRGKVLVRREIEEGELDSYRKQLPDCGIVALEVGMLRNDELFDDPQAWLHAIRPGIPAQPELQHIAENLGRPATTEDVQFGTFILNRRLNWHEAHTFWGKDGVRLTLTSGNADEAFPEETLAQARILWDEQARWDREARDFMAGELLALKNDNWLDEGEAELTAEEFVERATVESIKVSPDGKFEFWYNDGDLFWGHSIMVSGSLEEGINDAGIHG
jgi:hypothetical protein